MSEQVSRRGFVKAAGAAAVGAAVLASVPKAGAGELTGRIKKAVGYGMIGGDMPVKKKFKLAKELGYDGVEISIKNIGESDEMLEASQSTGLPVHCVVNGGINNIPRAVDLAKKLGATGVLLVAGRVGPKMSYADNYVKTQATIREAIPHAEEQQILLLVENVWNNFLLSPLEMARYVDEFESDWVASYFDVGNVARFAWPAHWISALGSRIKRVHIKPYSRKKHEDEGLWHGFKVPLGDGDIDWASVRQALLDIEYTGWATAEVPGGDKAKLADIAARMDRVLDL